MSEIKEKILVQSEALFMKYGFKSVTMDDVSRELGISKKTLYQFFQDKNDLVNQCVEHHLTCTNTMCLGVMENPNLDAIGVMVEMTRFFSNMLTNVNPRSMFDLKKYFKSAWDKLELDRKTFIRKQMEKNLAYGVKKGVYRKDLNITLTASLYIHLISYLIDPDRTDENMIDFKVIYLEIVKYHMHSICTNKGLEILEEKLKSIK